MNAVRIDVDLTAAHLIAPDPGDALLIDPELRDENRAVSRAAGSSAPGFSFIDWEA